MSDALQDLIEQNAQLTGQILALRMVLIEVVGLLVMLDPNPGRAVRALFQPLMDSASRADQELGYADQLKQLMVEASAEAMHRELGQMQQQLLDRLAHTPRR